MRHDDVLSRATTPGSSATRPDPNVFGVMPTAPTATATKLTNGQLQTSTGLSPSHRLWSPTSLLVVQGAMLFFGLLTGGLAVADGELFAVVVALLMIGFAVSSFGWVDIEPGSVTQERVGRKKVIRADDVVGIDLGHRQSKSMTWWFPVFSLQSGKTVSLGTLSSLSRKRTVNKTRIIQAALQGDEIFVAPEPGASRGTVIPPSGPEIDPESFSI